MMLVPAVEPVTIPLVFPIVALELDELQVPPFTELVRVIVAPRQTLTGPEILAGGELMFNRTPGVVCV